MNRYSYFFVVLACLCLLYSCGNKKEKTREDQVEEFRSGLTEADTTAMLKLADNAMEQLKAKKIDQVIASLFEYNDSTNEVTPVSEETAKRYSRLFNLYPVLEYSRVYYSFMLEGCNDVKYSVTFATAEQVGGDKPATTMYMFNPVKVDGEWKLCVKTPTEEVDEAYR